MKNINITDYYRISSAAKATGVSRDFLKRRVDQGKVPCIVTACGLRLVKLEDAKNARTEKESTIPFGLVWK